LELTLLERFPQERDREFLNELEKKLQELSSGLNVNLRVSGLSKGGMPRFQVSGEDEEAFLEILQRSFGLAPESIQDLLDQPIRKGFIQKILEQENVLLIDLGLTDQSLYATLRAESLRSQLFDGVNVSLRSMVTRYGLLRDFPLEVRVVSCNGSGIIEVELSDRERDLLREWQCLPFDRIIIQNSLESEIIEAVKKRGLINTTYNQCVSKSRTPESDRLLERSHSSAGGCRPGTGGQRSFASGRGINRFVEKWN
jgi:hypothetical protein